MRHYLTVVDVLKLYPTRRKSWAYKQLQIVRDSTAQEFASVRDFAQHMGLPEEELRSLLGSIGAEK